MDVDALADEIRGELRLLADPERAVGQQAYMKSAMPFLGVRVPQVRSLTRSVAKRHGLGEVADIGAAARELWDDAEFREERYAANTLCGLRPDLSLVPLYEHMVSTGAWWDHTDEMAHRIAVLHDEHAEQTAAIVRGWAAGEHLWLRRLAILSQLQRKHRTDTELLTEVIDLNSADSEFFIAKAIGWALRDYARTDAAWVRSFLASHELQGLSRREAAKHL